MRYTETKDDSAVSPVIGVILMVAITVILAAVIGTFVLGLGENVDGTTSAGVSIDQVAGQSFSVNVVSVGNVDTSGIVGPDGERSAFGSSDDVLQAGATVRVADNANFAREPATVNSSNVPGLGTDAVLVVADDGGNALETDPANIQDYNPLTGSGSIVEECYIAHPADIVSGIRADGAGIGCSGLSFQLYGVQAAAATGDATAQDVSDAELAITTEFDDIGSIGNSYDVTGPGIITDAAEASSLSTGAHITYEEDAQYSFVGTVDGSENTIQSFTTEDD